MHANFSIMGLVMRVKGGKLDPKTDRTSSAIITVKTGPSRDNTGGAVEFINAQTLRVPGHTYSRLQRVLQPGAIVDLQGKLQGVFKQLEGGGMLVTELVVETAKPIKRETLRELLAEAEKLAAEEPSAAPARSRAGVPDAAAAAEPTPAAADDSVAG